MENRYWGLVMLVFAAGILTGLMIDDGFIIQGPERPDRTPYSYGRMGRGVGMMSAGLGSGTTNVPPRYGPMMNPFRGTLPVKITEAQAFEAVTDLIERGYFGSANFTTGDEIIKFRNGWEIEVFEEGGAVVYEFIVDPSTGAVFPEMGPNMMWNTRFGNAGKGMMGGGMMGRWTSQKAGAPFAVSEEQARALVEEYMTKNGIKAEIEEVERHPGYWEIHLVKDGTLLYQIDVNGYTGAVWLETWHLV